MKELIERMLDQLAEYQAQVDLLEIDKRKLLDEVQIPDEVLKAQNDANVARQAIDAEFWQAQQNIFEETSALVSQIEKPALPPEYVAAEAAYRAKLDQIQADENARIEQVRIALADKKNKLDAELMTGVKEIYAHVEQRKRDIMAEFDEKQSGAKDNIAALTARIKDETKKHGATVKGQFYQAVYVKGRTTWNTDMLEGLIVVMPQLEKARKIGEPSITLRRI